jgi:hypothetical protein
MMLLLVYADAVGRCMGSDTTTEEVKVVKAVVCDFVMVMR